MGDQSSKEIQDLSLDKHERQALKRLPFIAIYDYVILSAGRNLPSLVLYTQGMYIVNGFLDGSYLFGILIGDCDGIIRAAELLLYGHDQFY